MKPALSLTTLTAALLALTGCSRHAGDGAAAAAAPLPTATVRVAVVQAIHAPRLMELPGTVRPVDSASLAPKVMGTVEKVPVALGQSVKRGDVLVELSVNEIRAKLVQAEAGLNQAQRDLTRESKLLTDGASTPDIVHNLQDRLTMSQATVDEARTMLAYATITAPFDGVITRKFVNEGDLAAPGHPLVSIESPARLRVEVEVPESLASTSLGAQVIVSLGDTGVTGTVAEIAPASDAMSRTYLAKVDLPEGTPVRSGQFVRVAWPNGSGESLVIPASAVSLFGQMERVFVANNGRADLRLVRTGARREDQIEVLAGLSPGEKVITEGAVTLREGQALEIR